MCLGTFQSQGTPFFHTFIQQLYTEVIHNEGGFLPGSLPEEVLLLPSLPLPPADRSASASHSLIDSLYNIITNQHLVPPLFSSILARRRSFFNYKLRSYILMPVNTQQNSHQYCRNHLTASSISKEQTPGTLTDPGYPNVRQQR